jgi:hypothetical protein
MLVAGCRRLLSRLAMNTGRAGYERFAGLGIGSLEDYSMGGRAV